MDINELEDPYLQSVFNHSTIAGRYELTGKPLIKLGYALLPVKDKTLGRSVTIAVPQLTDQFRGIEQSRVFFAEARGLARLNHPNIISVFDANLAGKIPYFISQQIVGPSLREVVTSTGPLPLGRAMRICLQIANAISYAHDASTLLGGLDADGVFLDGRSTTIDNVQIVQILTSLWRLHDVCQAHHTERCGWYSPANDIYTLGEIAAELLMGLPPSHNTYLQLGYDRNLPEKVIRLCKMLLRRDDRLHLSSGRVAADFRRILEAVERGDLLLYDVAISFAGEDRAHAEALAAYLKKRSVRVFYDRYETSEIWGANLYARLHSIYCEAAKFCVVFVSRSYRDKLWTTHELRAAQERALMEGSHSRPIGFKKKLERFV